MRRLIRIILVVTMALVIGCAAGRHTTEGNKHFAAKNYDMAVKEYEEALALKPELADDAVFQDRLEEARIETLYKKGTEFQEQLRWDEAIERFIECLDIDECHTPARKALMEARTASSKAHLQAGLSRADSGKLYEAIDELTISIELDPDNKAAQTALDIAIKAKRENERKAEEHFRTGMAFLLEKDWNKSVQEFEACIKHNPSHVLARSKTKEAQDQIDSANDLYNRGMEFFERKDWDPATRQFEAALKVSPFFQAPVERIEEAAENKKQAGLFCLSGDKYFGEKRLDEAIAEYGKALDSDPNHGPSKNMLAKALGQAAAKHSSAGNRFLNEGDLRKAVIEFTSALEYVPDLSPAREGLAKIFCQRGSDFETAGKPGNALIEFRKALLMVPDYGHCPQKTAAIEQRIQQRTTYSVALLPLSNSSKDSAIAGILGERLLDALMRRDMKHIKIVERGSLNNILREQPLSMRDLMDPDTALPAGGIKGVDAIVSGKVSSFEIYSRETLTPLSQRYQSGTRQVENYQYERAQQKVWDLQDKVSRERDYVARYKAEYNETQSRASRARQKYYDFERSFDAKWCRGHRDESNKYRDCKEVLSTLAKLKSGMNDSRSGIGDTKIQLNSRTKQLERLERDLRSAQNRLINAHEYMDEPVYSLWHYRIRHVTKHCSLAVTCRAVDTTTGSVLFSSKAGKTTEDKDDYVDNPNPSAGVRGDPLVLKSDTEIINQVAEPVVVEITDHIASSLETYGNKYFELGNEAARNGHNEEAVEQYVNFLYCCPKCAPSDRKEAMVFIKKARSYDCDDIEAMDCKGYWGVHGKNSGSPQSSLEETEESMQPKKQPNQRVQSSEVPIGWISPPYTGTLQRPAGGGIPTASGFPPRE